MASHSFLLRLAPGPAMPSGSTGNDVKRAKRKQPWVARVTGAGGRFGVDREFLTACIAPDGQLEYTLDPGALYEVNANLGWTTQRYFCLVKGDTMAKLSKKEALAWLAKR